ncbi:Thioredoxin [Candidatus Magnetomoraceae bacterium gMMP-13]
MKLATCLIISFMFFSEIFFNYAFAERVQWHSYDKGIEQSKIKNKKVFLNFYSNQCGYCTKMSKEVFSDRAVANYLQENFIPVKINAEKYKKLARSYGARGLPFFWFLKPGGERISNLPGYIPRERFLNFLKFIHTTNYQKMGFNEFVQSISQSSKKKIR